MVLRLLLVVPLALLVSACDDEADEVDAVGGAGPMPAWVEAVYPEPGSTAAVPDAVEVDHDVTEADTDVDIRLLVDGTDVTTYATFDAGKIRYESGTGPVTLGTGDHTAEIQRVSLPVEGAQYDVIDSFEWEFRTG